MLDDPASHAAVVAHLVELSRFAPWLAAYYHDCRTALGAWRQQYRRAPRAVRARMRAAYDPREAAALLNILGRLYDESYADMTQIVAFGADAFVLPGF